MTSTDARLHLHSDQTKQGRCSAIALANGGSRWLEITAGTDRVALFVRDAESAQILLDAVQELVELF